MFSLFDDDTLTAAVLVSVAQDGPTLSRLPVVKLLHDLSFCDLDGVWRGGDGLCGLRQGLSCGLSGGQISGEAARSCLIFIHFRGVIFVRQRDGRVDGETPPLNVDPVELADDADIADHHHGPDNSGNVGSYR